VPVAEEDFRLADLVVGDERVVEALHAPLHAGRLCAHRHGTSVIVVQVPLLEYTNVNGFVPAEEFVEFDSMREAALAYLAHVHQAAVAQLLDHEIVDDHVHLVRVGLDAAYEVGLALIYLLDQLVQ
jgi:hypothetical protein